MIFESSLEKIARIMARQFSIQVVFEGDQAKTDGKTITLPAVGDIDEETAKDLNGYLDHEVSHCKFTSFEEFGLPKNAFHRNMLNAVEDIRIERLMVEDYPGTRFHIEPLRDKVESKAIEGILANPSHYPLPNRFNFSLQRIMQNKSYDESEDLKPYLEACSEEIAKLNSCTDTKSVRLLTEKIVKKFKDQFEEEEKGKDKEVEGDGEARDGNKSPTDKETKRMISGAAKDSDFDKIDDMRSFINEKLKDIIKEEAKTEFEFGYTFSKRKHSVPSTTRFDTVTDLSGKGHSGRYAALKRDVLKMVNPIRASLERLLKVKEKAKWSFEKDRGILNRKSLSKMAIDKSYRSVFKDFTKTETNNVAVVIFVDLSGSMSGKIDTAKKATIAMSEALKDLDITFEVSGFNSVGSSEMHNFSRTVDAKRFNRTSEKLDLYIFKSFDNPSLTGIERIFVGNENPDGECIAWAAKRLSERKEKRKILMVLSDGMPNTSDADSKILNSHLKHNVAQMSKFGIECIGIGIMTEAVSLFYEDHIVLRRISDLPKEAMKKLAKVIG